MTPDIHQNKLSRKWIVTLSEDCEDYHTFDTFHQAWECWNEKIQERYSHTNMVACDSCEASKTVAEMVNDESIECRDCYQSRIDSAFDAQKEATEVAR